MNIELRIGRDSARRFFIDMKNAEGKWVKVPGTYGSDSEARRAAIIIGEKLKLDIEGKSKDAI